MAQAAIVRKSVVIGKAAKHNIPKELLEILVKEYDSSVGAVSCEEGKTLLMLQHPEGATMEQFDVNQKGFENDNVLYVLGKGTPVEDDIQPYVIVQMKSGQENVPLIVAVVDGEFKDFQHDGSTKSNCYHFVSEYLEPKVFDMWNSVGGDVKKLFEKMNTTVFQREMLQQIGDRGLIAIMGSNGAICRWFKGDTYMEADWGWVSDRHGFGTPKELPAGVHQVPEKPKTFGLASFGKKVANTVTDAVKSATTTAKTPEGKKPAPVAEATPPVDTEKTDVDNAELASLEAQLTQSELYTQCPTDVKSSKNIKRHYRTNAGYLPNDWENRPRVKISGAKVKNLINAKKHQENLQAAAARKTQTPEATKPVIAKDFKEMGATLGKKPATETAQVPITEHKNVSTNNIPMEVAAATLSADEKKRLGQFLSDGKIVQSIDKHSKIVDDPEKYQSYELKVETFSDVSGLEMEEIKYWPPEVINMLIKDHPHAAQVLISELAYTLFKKELEVEHLKGKYATTNEQPEETVKPAAPAATKTSSGLGGMFGGSSKKKAVA